MATKPITIKRQQSITPKSSGQYWEKLKNVEVKKISQYKSKETNLKTRHYWNDVIREMERLAMQQAEQTKIKINDLSTSLPPKLYKRISKIIPLNPIEDDLFEDEFEDKSKIVNQDYSDSSISGLPKWKQDSFNESTCTLIPEQESILKKNEVQKKTLIKNKPKRNWQSEFLCQKQKDRIKWNSKLYQLKNDIFEKPLYEQAEELMDSSAESFLEWLNNLSQLSDTNITKDELKSLLSLESNALLAGSIEIQPKIMGAVPAQVADTWNTPDKSISLKLQQKLDDLNEYKKSTKKMKTHAFGRSLPPDMIPWVPHDSLHVLKSDIPEDLSQCKIVFEGITHLRPIKKLIKYYDENPDEERPGYLKQIGCFNKNAEKRTSAASEAPLYELLQLKS